MVVGDSCLTLVHRVDELLAVDRIADGLTDARIGERSTFGQLGVEPDLTMVRRRRTQDLDRVVLEQIRTIGDREVLDDVDFASGEGRDLGATTLEALQRDTVELD